MELARLEVAGRRESGRFAGLDRVVAIGVLVIVGDLAGDVRLDLLPRGRGRCFVLGAGVEHRGLVGRDRLERGQVGRWPMELARLQVARRGQAGRRSDRLVTRFHGRGEIGHVRDRGLLIVEEDRVRVGKERVRRRLVAGLVAQLISSVDDRCPCGRERMDL